MIPQRCMICNSEFRIVSHQSKGLFAGSTENISVLEDVGDSELRHPALTGPEELAGTSQLQIHFRNPETIAGLNHCLQPGLRMIFFLESDRQAADHSG